MVFYLPLLSIKGLKVYAIIIQVVLSWKKKHILSLAPQAKHKTVFIVLYIVWRRTALTKKVTSWLRVIKSFWCSWNQSVYFTQKFDTSEKFGLGFNELKMLWKVRSHLKNYRNVSFKTVKIITCESVISMFDVKDFP